MRQSNGNNVYRNACLGLGLLAAYCSIAQRVPLAAAIVALGTFLVLPFLIGLLVPTRSTATGRLGPGRRGPFQFRLSDLLRWVFLCALGALAVRETSRLFSFGPTTEQFASAIMLLVLCVISVVPAAVLYWMRGNPRRITFVVAGFTTAWLTVVATSLAVFVIRHL